MVTENAKNVNLQDTSFTPRVLQEDEVDPLVIRLLKEHLSTVCITIKFGLKDAFPSIT